MVSLRRLLFSVLATTTLPGASVNTTPPQFDQYAVLEKFSGPVAKPILRSKQDREFRGQLQRAARMQPNYAGHYVLATFGCGASCVTAGALDARSGRVTWLPFTVCCGNHGDREPIEFRPDSALLIVRGMRNKAGDGTYYYRIAGGSFKLIAELSGGTAK
jgi:hypothetical protein